MLSLASVSITSARACKQKKEIGADIDPRLRMEEKGLEQPLDTQGRGPGGPLKEVQISFAPRPRKA